MSIPRRTKPIKKSLRTHGYRLVGAEGDTSVCGVGGCVGRVSI